MSSSAAAKQPSDVELLNDYLRPWVATGAVNRGESARVHEVDLYSADPAFLAERLAATESQDGNRAWYFLSPLRTKSERGVGTRKLRTVPAGPGGGEGGCWHKEAKQKEVSVRCGEQVGFRTFFSFRRKDDASEKPGRGTGWIMWQFSLHKDEEDGRLETRVLCKVYRSPRHRDPEAESDADDDDDSKRLSAEAASAGDDEDSHAGNDVGAKKKAAAPGAKKKAAAPGAEKKVAPARKKLKVSADDDNSSGPASARKGKAVGDEGLLATPPSLKNVRAEDDQSSGPASASKEKAASAPTAELHCPQCGFHLGVLKADVSPTKSETKTGMGAAPQGDPEKDHFI